MPPYEYNAGIPYEKDGHKILKVAYWCGMMTSAEIFYKGTTFSVEKINSGAVPWLQSFDGSTKIMAGATLAEFVEKVRSENGEVYFSYISLMKA